MFDVRVIDFAHSTHANLPNNNHSSSSPLSSPNKSMMIQHHGYDEGFVYGLDNLNIKMMKRKIQNKLGIEIDEMHSI
ncbi:hypothetical protein BLA29_010916 [Euroglyphus maynei]|uniref:Uncharacterized protein n=1 Tax=Euroglyphus maynei TaxID=6958 RepID=A0A1Y3B4S5_EURMA|nr:hypothetical protein BLA29_010916 [Euroglyphus maynei]